jgi:hypothetical protein
MLKLPVMSPLGSKMKMLQDYKDLLRIQIKTSFTKPQAQPA